METATLIAIIINAITMIVLILQLQSTKKQITINYEESKREKTLDIMFTWVNSTKKETSFAEMIAEKLDDEQCRKLYNRQPFAVNQEIKELLCIICPYKDSPSCLACNEVKGEQLVQFRWHVMSYLNSLETVLVAWQMDAVCKDTIEEQFSYLWDSTKGWNALQRMRNAAGGTACYPAIAAFCECIKQKKDSTTTKPPVITNHKTSVSL